MNSSAVGLVFDLQSIFTFRLEKNPLKVSFVAVAASSAEKVVEDGDLT